MLGAAPWPSRNMGQTIMELHSVRVLVSLKYLWILETQKDHAKCRTTNPMNDNNQTFPSATRASLVAQLVKNLPAMLETWVWSLGWEDPLEKGKATHSSILVKSLSAWDWMSSLTGRMLLDKKLSWNLTCFLSTSNSQLLGREILHLSLIVVPEDFYAGH